MSDQTSDSLQRLGLPNPTHTRTHEQRYLLTDVNHLSVRNARRASNFAAAVGVDGK